MSARDVVALRPSKSIECFMVASDVVPKWMRSSLLMKCTADGASQLPVDRIAQQCDSCVVAPYNKDQSNARGTQNKCTRVTKDATT